MKGGFKYDGYLKHIADDKLLSEIKRLVNEERDIQIEVIHHLAEINARRLHEARGYSSLHEYAVRGLGYSDGAAQRRIKTMRLCADLPEVEELIRPGKLNLTSASQLQSMFERQQRSAQREAAPEQVWNDEKKLDLVRKVEGKSTRETERLIADAAPEVAAPQERSRYLGNGKWELRIVVTETVWSELESLKDLLSHRIPSRSNSELLALLAHDGSTKYDPRRRGRGRRVAQASAPRAAAQGSPLAGAGDHLVAPAPLPDTGPATPAPENAGTPLTAPAPQPARSVAPASAPAQRGRRAAQASAPRGAAQGSPRAGAGDQLVVPAPLPDTGSAAPAPENAGGRLTAAAPQPARSVAPASAPAQRGRRAAQASAPRGAAQASAAGAGDQLVAPAPLPDTGSATPAPEYAAARRRTTTRQVPAAIRRAVWVRDQGRCQFVDAATGTRCGSRYQLQLDHLQPWACGGDHDETNLQLACSRHNRYRARRTFGARTRARGACSAAERRSGL